MTTEVAQSPLERAAVERKILGNHFGMKTFTTLGSLTLVGALSIVTIGAAPPAMSPAGQDARFAATAAQGGMGEVTLAKLALQNGQSGAVKTFARRMIADHGKANMKLMAIASSQHIVLPAGLDTADAAMQQQLSGLHGAAFDAAYMRGQMTAHEKTAALMQHEVAAGKDAALVTFAKTTLPTVETHLSMDKSDVASMSRM